jgi:hypothetical protein
MLGSAGLGRTAGLPGRGEGSKLAGLLARVPRALHRRLAHQAWVLPSLQEEALATSAMHAWIHHF